MNGTEMNTLTLSRPVTDSPPLHDHRIDFIFIYLNIYIYYIYAVQRIFYSQYYIYAIIMKIKCFPLIIFLFVNVMESCWREAGKVPRQDRDHYYEIMTIGHQSHPS